MTPKHSWWANLRLAWAILAAVFLLPATVHAQGPTFIQGTCPIYAGSASPEGAITAPVCSLYLRSGGGAGTVLYVKETGTGNTGWVAYAGGSGAFAPVGATYIVQTADATLSAEQALAALATGYMKVTTTTGVVSSQAVPIPAGDGGTGNQFFSVSGPATSVKTFTFPNVNSTMVAQDSTDTLTNKTLDAEGTGNLVTMPFRSWLRAGWCQNVTAGSTWSTPTSNPAVLACDTGTNTQKAVWQFADGASVLSVQADQLLPADFTGAVDLKFRWFTAATTGDVVWQAAAACVADGETSDPAFGTASTVIDTAKGTTLQDNEASITGLTITGCAAGEILYLRVFRDPGHASDTLADTASLRGVEVTLRRGM